MSVRRGHDWGGAGPLSPGAAVVGSDAALIDAVIGDPPVTDARVFAPSSAEEVPEGAEVGLLGGDLHRTLGSPRHSAEQLYAGEGVRLPVDLCAVELSDDAARTSTRYFCAHLVATRANRRLFAGHTVVAMNAAFRGEQNLAPRAHPGDGLIDTIEGSLGFTDRMRAHRRLATGTHVPHPRLQTRRSAEATFEFSAPARIVLDGRAPVHATRLTIRCIPDALTVVV